MFKSVLGAAAAVAFTVASGSAAVANPIYGLTLQDAGGTASATDNGAGMINYNGTLGGFNIQNLAASDLNPTNPLHVAVGSNDILRATGSDTLFSSNLFSYPVKFTRHLLTNKFANQVGSATDLSRIRIPEPSSLALLAAGLVGLAAIRRKRI